VRVLTVKSMTDSNARIGGSAGSLMARETYLRARGWLRAIAQERPTADPPPAMRNNWLSSLSLSLSLSYYGIELFVIHAATVPRGCGSTWCAIAETKARSHELSPRPQPYRVAFGQETPIPSAQACLRLPGKLETQTSVSSPALSRRARDCASRLLVCPRAIQP
jgi:hypothetical protein